MILSISLSRVYAAALMITLLLAQLANAQALKVDANTFQIDHGKKLVLVNKQSNQALLDEAIILGETPFVVDQPATQVESGIPYAIRKDGESYTLYFTELPVVNLYVSSMEDINRTSEIPGNIYVSDTRHGVYSSTMAIRIRGASSANFPKKSYRVQLKDDQGSNKHESILGMRSDRRWLMLAMYNEPLRNNNKFSHDLWLDMHKPYYQDSEPDALSTIRSEYVETFINGEYRGIYLFAEDADQKQFKLKNKSGGGELYKGEARGRNNTFDKDYHGGGIYNDFPAIASPEDELWGGWELRHPGSTDWNNLYDFTDFVINSTDEDFKKQIGSKLHLDNAIDYFIFLNLLRATDNTNKNTLLVRYQQDEPYFYGVWDLDGVLGTMWSGHRDPLTNGLLLNNLYARLLATNPQYFKLRLASRWIALRKGLLATSTFKERFFGLYRYLLEQGAYDRELLVREADQDIAPWEEALFDFSEEQINYVDSWIDARFAYLDSHFTNLYIDALPVKLASFQLSYVEDKVKIEWSVTESSNVSHFTLERSATGQGDWIPLSDLRFDKSSSYYSFVDSSPLPKMNYYRIKTTDLDGSFDYSPLRSIETKRLFAGSFFPNPAKAVLRFKPDDATKKVHTISLVTTYGTTVPIREISGAPNSFDIKHVAAGMYVAVVRFEDGHKEHHRIILLN